ncbi:probable palmitoyltransferase ZDHHC24 [Macrosteles quadrilineatus]|uniref:probable palmitoyltransferase ZDHHC24 n=1 Tax=Macrosteles quadrilineatus TaxID=74068 RepID=UPI0023E0B4C5|nr:probable palmitoyltransferase ZDHHC24 [Macrosteles quadrilineatus]
MKLRKYILPRCFGDLIAFLFIIGILPFGYWFEVFLVLPSMYPLTSVWYIMHSTFATFLLINITSNFVYMVLMDTSIQGELMPSTPISPTWKFCAVCETVTPPRSWHCSICNICILKRDHHCQFAGCCVGHLNQRYFFYFLAYLAIGTVYALYFNTFFLFQYTKFSALSFIKFTFPLAIFLLGIDYSIEHCYTLFYVINLLGMLSAVFLLYYHGSSMTKGLVMYENSHNIFDYDSGSLKENIKQVFGDRWYVTWVSPFIQSKLPSDGINWVSKKKEK